MELRNMSIWVTSQAEYGKHLKVRDKAKADNVTAEAESEMEIFEKWLKRKVNQTLHSIKNLNQLSTIIGMDAVSISNLELRCYTRPVVWNFFYLESSYKITLSLYNRSLNSYSREISEEFLTFVSLKTKLRSTGECTQPVALSLRC